MAATNIRWVVVLVGARRSGVAGSLNGLVGPVFIGKDELRVVEKEAFIDGLDSTDHGGAEDVVGTGTSADFGGGFTEAGDDLPEGVSSSDVLHEFKSDVAAVEVGKNQDVSSSGDGRIDIFISRDVGIESGVDLNFSCYFDFKACLFREVTSEFGGFSYLQNGRMLGGAARGETEHGDAGRFVGQMPGDHRGGESDVGQLLGSRFGDDAAV